jgi:hypothetical protein
LTVPDTLKRLDRIIHATKESILDVCRLLEGCRKEVYEGNTIPLGSKMKWVLGDSVAFARRTSNLQQQHAALNVEIVNLSHMDMLKPLERIATTTFENVELLSMERKKTQKRDSRLDKGEFTILDMSVINRFEDCQSRGSDTYVLDVGQFLPFGLGISPMASPTGLPLYLQQPVHNDYRCVSNNARPSIPTASEFNMEEGESTEVEENGDDDAESAFYRDLRQQEEERQRRLAARRRIG